MKKDDVLNDDLAEDLKASADERRLRMRIVEREKFNSSIEGWTRAQDSARTQEDKEQYQTLINSAWDKVKLLF